MQRQGKIASLLVAALLGCVVSARADEAGSHPIDSTLEVLGLKTKPGPMPGFVEQSRGAQTQDEYLPVGASAPKRALAPKSAADVKALTAELDAARDAQLAGKRPKPMGDGHAAAKPAPATAGAKPPKRRAGAAPATIR
ncbi:hypothetical protein P7D22_15255 [Lichenihabitans sp. Uapishka_5]|uniref:hypothetical protein n=1 Tax=Lichenihabitans sp. Uapishka_5 TaxID=3037302 RepID=UPI0029E7DC71|nr:hypothetical protein [Lichenihabitans sp. Uapishka_5]MDX7952526.1 hypothetical protein [Lichenihabitans sp. Uapishka_5]